MTRDQLRWLLLLMVTLAVVVFLVSLWDIVSAEDWMQPILAIESILLILTVVLVYLVFTQKSKLTLSTPRYEQPVDRSLKHFQCPRCNGIFPVKRSYEDSQQSFRLTCPDCGYSGRVSVSSNTVEASLPEK